MTVLEASPPLVSTELEPLVERQLLAPAASIGIDLPVVGVSEVPRQPVLTYAGNRPWYFCNYIEDPTARQFGGYIPVPEAEHVRLTAQLDAGVRPNVVWLAHEVPATWREGQELPNLVPPDVRPVVRPGAVTVSGQRLSVQVVRRAVDFATGVAANRPRVINELRHLDPIVLGGVTDAAGEYAAWVELARWDWSW